MDKELIRQFNIRMIDLYQQTKEETGYNPTRFLQMITSTSGYEAAQALLHTNKISDGCTTLWELGRLDLTLAIKNGHLQVNLGAESAMVKDIIEANLNQLKLQLNDQGLIVDRFDVMVGLENRRFQDNEKWHGSGRRSVSSLKKSGIGDECNIMDEVPSEKSINKQYQIDVHV